MSCPTDKSLLQYVLGTTLEDEAVKLAQHLAGCHRCCETLDALHPSDTIVEAVRAAKHSVVTVADVNEPLIDKLCQFGLAVAAYSQPTVAMNAAEEQAAESRQQAATAEACDFLAPPQAADELGRLGPYRVLRVLGTGGMGVVFLAEDPQLQRLVALKAMKPALAVSESARKRFLREARSTAAIEHDHIVGIHQVGEDRGVPFLAMPLLRGESLEDRLKREHHLPLANVLRIGREVALGLAAAHQRGLIHRDIKPANIWLESRNEGSEVGDQATGVRRQESGVRSQESEKADARDVPASASPRTPNPQPPAPNPPSPARAKILDFGLARAADDDLQLTQTGAVAGTPAYMSPEQAQGEHVDHRSDLFSLGAMLYRLCTGELPFAGVNTMSILLAVASRQPKPPHELNPDVPSVLSALVLRLLAKHPSERPQSAREVVEAITAIERSSGGWARLPVIPTATGKRGHPTSATAVSAVTLNPPISPASRETSAVGWPPLVVPIVGTGGKSQPTKASAPEHALSPKTSGASRPPARRNRTSIALATAAVLLMLGPLSYYFGATVIRFVSNKGELVVDIDDPNIEVVVRQENLVVRDKTTDREFVLKAANGEVDVYEKDTGLKLLTRQFTLTRGGKARVTAHSEEIAQARADHAKRAELIASDTSPDDRDRSAETPVRLADKEKPFVLIRADGQREEFRQFTEAQAVLQNGDSIEVHGNGPFVLGHVRIPTSALTLRAAAGYRPMFLAADSPETHIWFSVADATLLVEGCDFRFFGGPHVFQGKGDWEFRNCRFVGHSGTIFEHQGPQLRVADCLFATDGWVCGLAAGASLELSNNIVCAAGVIGLRSNGGQTLRLTGNTFRSIFPHQFHAFVGAGPNVASFQPATLVATRNLFDFDSPFLSGSVGDWPARLQWRGEHNLYATGKLRVPVAEMKEGMPPSLDLAGWARFWGQTEPEPGSLMLEGPVVFHWEEFRHLPAEQAIQSVREEIEKVRREQALPADFGPDWDLIGPGEAYVRALAANGQPAPAEKLRPAAPAGGPFVLLRDSNEPKGFVTLQEAMSASADGDIIEIRTNGPFPGGSHATPNRMRLIVRAGAGYHPVVLGDISFSGDLVLEGLEFRTGVCGGRLIRFANCSFLSDQVFAFGADPLDEAETVIENCFIRSSVIDFGTTPGTAFLFRNSVIPILLNTPRPSNEAGEVHFRIVRSIGWNPLGGHMSSSTLFQSHPTQCKIRLETDRSLFDAGLSILGGFAEVVGGWKGSRCVYRQPTPGFLQSLKTRWQSTEEGSQELLPLVAEPRAWQLWEQSAGYRAGPDGKDFGADVTRVARTQAIKPTASQRTPGAVAASSPNTPDGVAPSPAKTLTDKEKPFVLLRAGRAKREEFKHASAAFTVFQDGDTLEVHGNGPFPMPVLFLGDRSLTLRAAPGYRPRFVPLPAANPPDPNHGHGWFTLQRAGLIVEGCDFVGFVHHLFGADSSAKELDVRNCQILSNLGAVVWSKAKVRFKDCLIHAVPGYGPGVGRLEAGECVMENNIIVAPSVFDQWQAGELIVRLHRNTIWIAPGTLYVAWTPTAKVTIEAESNVIHGELMMFPPTIADEARNHVTWQGRNNLYSASGRWLSREDPAGPVSLVKDLGEWISFWGNTEQGSRAVERTRFAFDGANDPDVAAAIRFVRENTQDDCRAAGDIGPDWELVGPGAAYVKALEKASGQPIPKEQLRPDAPVGGPFVVLRDGKLVRGWTTLDEALIATQDGDTVEIRTDGPFPAPLAHARHKKRLTIRAAPGYLPVLNGSLDIAGADVTAIEGIQFRQGVPGFAYFGGSLRRLANCSIDAPNVWVGANDVGHEQRAEVVNCFFPNVLYTLRNHPGGRVALKNTVLGRVFGEGGKGEHSFELVVEHCVFWQPAPELFGLFQSHPVSPRMRFGIHKTLFESGSSHGILGNEVDLWVPHADWRGTNNVYRQTHPEWIDSLQRTMKSPEDGSRMSEPLIFRPAMWRLVGDADNRGADVDRVARTPVAQQPSR